MKDRVAHALDSGRRLATGRRPLSRKQHGELHFWRRELDRYLDWYEGRMPHLWGVPPPDESVKVHGHGARENALLTWSAVGIAEKYLSHLLVPHDHFSGMKVLDVGCGPIPYALVFSDCEIVGLDELLDEYRRLGFPLERYAEPSRLSYLRGSAERIPAADHSFDAVISVNALDHVRDFPVAAREIVRVLRPDGVVRVQLHCHSPTVLEPWALNDELVRSGFAGSGLEKLHEIRVADLPRSYPDASGPDERQVVWANDNFVPSESFEPLRKLRERQAGDLSTDSGPPPGDGRWRANPGRR